MNYSMTLARVAALCTFVAAAAATAVALPASAQTPASTPAQPGTSPATAPDPQIDATLHQELGGTAGIAALMSDFVVRLKADARIGRFFEKSNLPELSRQLTDQICALSGGPCVYRGAPMKIVHADIEIRRADFNALVEVLQDSMDARGIAFRTQNRLLARLAWMHRAIVNMPDPR